jgi:hypothetical protein
MRAALLLLLVVALGGLLLLCGPFTLLPGDAARGIRGQPLLEVLALLGQERERRERLDTAREAVQRCIEGKNQAVQDVLKGRADLLGAAAAFRDWQRAVPAYDWGLFRQAFPADSEEESLCLSVISMVEQALEGSPGERAAWAANLRSQLKLYREGGTIRLPRRGGS